MCSIGGGGGAVIFAAGSDRCRWVRTKAASHATFVCLTLVCSLVLQGCDYFADPDEVGTDDSVWQPKELKHTPWNDYMVDFKRIAEECNASSLRDSLVRIRTAYSKEAQATIPEDIPDTSRNKHIAIVFPEDPFMSFVTDGVSGFLNKNRAYCRVLYFFPEMSVELQDKLILEEIQGSIATITQFLFEAPIGWDAIKANAGNDGSASLQALKQRHGLQELSDDHFIRLRSVVQPLEQDFFKAMLFATEAFARGLRDGSGSLRMYFEVSRKDEKCFWDVHGEKEIAEIGKDGAKVLNTRALVQAM